MQRAGPRFFRQGLLGGNRQLFFFQHQTKTVLDQILELAAPQGGLGFGTAEQFVGDINRRPHALHLSILMRKCKGGSPRRVDRKSTRLNSSHLGISYAVFCLKKKKKNNNKNNKL